MRRYKEPLTALQMFLLDVLILWPVGAWFLMLGTPHLGLHISYVSALWAHLLIGAAMSMVRFVVRNEEDVRNAAWHRRGAS